jgi:predicted lipoprotein
MKIVRMVAFVLLVATLPACKIVKNDSLAKKSGGEQDISSSSASTFDPKAYVAEIWDSKVLPYIDKRAADIGVVFGGLKDSPDETSKKYGYKLGEEGTYYNFAVKGTVKILRVDTESRNGIAYGDMKPYDGKEDFALQIGPVLKGVAIRDILDFISLDSFANQVEFARLGSEFNAKVRDAVIGSMDPASMVGATFDMTAAFTLDGASDLPVLTPVRLSKAGK